MPYQEGKYMKTLLMLFLFSTISHSTTRAMSDEEWEKSMRERLLALQTSHTFQHKAKFSEQAAHFSWITEHVGGMRLPESNEELKTLDARNVGLIISLTEQPLPNKFFNGTKLQKLHLPIEDFKAPTIQQVQEMVHHIKEQIATGKKVIIHCRGGIGRTGTMLACWLVAEGMNAKNAIDTIRQLRRGSIETKEQEKLVHAYFDSLKN